MKRIVLKLLFCAVVLMLCVSTALADAWLSIGELAQSVPDYWDTDLVFDGEKVSVPIYVPDVEKMPVLKVQPHQFEDDELYALGALIDSDPSYFSIINEGEYATSNGSGRYVQSFIGNIWQQRWRPTFSKIYSEHAIWDSQEQMNPQMTYADNQFANMDYAIELAKTHYSQLLREGSAWGVFFNHAEIYSPFMYLKNGEYTDIYPLNDLTGVGGYNFRGCFSYGGVPIFDTIAHAYFDSISGKLDAAIRRESGLDFLYYSDDFYWMSGTPWKTAEIIYEDVPLCPLDDVIAALQKEIEKGVIKNIHSLKLGYVIFASHDENYPSGKKSTSEQWAQAKFVLVPTWICECSYLKDPNRDYDSYPENQYVGAFDYTAHDWLKRKIMVNAQTGELYELRDKSDDRDYAPVIKTW